MSKRAPTVYAFMDESGDPGRDIRRGASRHFVLVLVETTEPDTLRDELERLRLALNLHEQFEFHYHSTRSVERRAAFFVLLRALNLKVRAAIIDKNHLPQSFSAFDTELYAFAVGELVTRAEPNDLEEAILIVDGERGETTEKTIAGIRKHLSRLYESRARVRAFKKLIARNSETEAGLQFADMVVGALAERAVHGESPYDDYVDSKLVDLWWYPEK
ncbi:MAG: DUF3800 domain-containing protein [Chloroflexota bacterium]|nr:MAG: DUF3800 domain-containing protein [Chloroflexota bacterium]